eukprot:495689-Pelagomonas_calceolata.AAC.2
MFAVIERAVDACSNFLFAVLDMITAISVYPCPPVRDFECEGTKLLRSRDFFLIIYVWIGTISRNIYVTCEGRGSHLNPGMSRQI